MDNFSTCAAFTILQEGGLVLNPNDHGGITNFGITINTLSKYRKAKATTDDVRALTLKEARAIYKQVFWDEVHIDRIHETPCVQMALFDFAVNSGEGAAVRTLQNCLIAAGENIKADGELGLQTKGALTRVVAESSDLKVATMLVRARRTFLARVCDRDKSQTMFLAGWIGRTHALEDAMIAQAQG